MLGKAVYALWKSSHSWCGNVSMLKPVHMKTFHEYAKLIFVPYIKSNLRNAIRVDVIWAVYLPAYHEHIPILDDSIM